jgi:5-methyltetrahydropteroyltriglutamate--homocysteine methyltransferase
MEGIMKRSTDRILTTHTGSLPRPAELLGLLKDREEGRAVDGRVFDDVVRRAVAQTVRRQADAGVTVLNDGEMGKISYSTYVKDRLTGFEGEEITRPVSLEARDFPDYAASRRLIRTLRRPTCNGPVAWKDFAAVQRDIDNLKAATKGAKVGDVFMTSASPGVISFFLPNQHYKSEEEYLYALADVMRREYKAIVDAGLVLQLDCPDLAMSRNSQFMDLSDRQFRKVVDLHVEVLNHAVAGLPPGQMRMHVCWGNGAGPHNHDPALTDILDIVLKARPAGFSFVAANGRHEHEWKVWKDVKVPAGKVLIPGVIDSTTNIVEHPELVAERILRYANIVGRENVIAGSDCGFGTLADWVLVDGEVAWAKLASLGEGAKLASKELWRRPARRAASVSKATTKRSPKAPAKAVQSTARRTAARSDGRIGTPMQRRGATARSRSR